MTTVDPGATVKSRTLTTITGTPVDLPAQEGLVHVQFRRFAACPICSVHLREINRRHDEITDAGVSEIVVFHSTAEVLRRYQADLPFPVVADPKRALYDEFGVQQSMRSLRSTHVARAIGRGVLQMRSPRELFGSIAPTENHLGLPADFLIAADGEVRARKYGTHADDQWSVDELLAAARR